ncbi:PepSY domain-containing protein [Ectothiorhodospira lacustris]|uniref:PepSY domain-containing protein n=1 Tax=Ectothiorhodospira lacustris TaxID=2899127 RepID=UPI001EE900E6|nr:PepSY domain-containing protein [Ectothiorhodospira lacustris]MCG5502152.1 peptidase M4 [Ectothiorhodospira lacustris]MCG5509510.1 peptidase M4 [Ectothiorhodospira lacustris]MCG5521695.1 peptidase M4 [Ectothiorhodospira lacustris]
MHIRSLTTPFLCLALLAPGLSPAGDRMEHNEILRLRAAGEIMPMEEVLRQAAGIVPGQFIEAELEREDGRYVYELKILDADGVRHKLYLNASDASLIKRERDR